MRKEFTMTEDQRGKILDASKPTPVMFLSGGKPMFDTPQENANHAWRLLGEEIGFDYMTVKGVAGKDDHIFSAEEAPVAEKGTALLDEEGNVLEEASTEIAEFRKTEAALNELRLKFTIIPDCSTKDGYEECRVGIRELVTLRTSLDKKRKELDTDDRARIKLRMDEAKRITSELVNLEQPLKDAKAAIDDAAERIKEEARIKEEKRVAAIEVAIDTISEGLNAHPGMEAVMIREFLEHTKKVHLDFDFEEFDEAADLERERVVSHLEAILNERVTYETGQEELKTQQAAQQKIADEQAARQKELDDQAEANRLAAEKVETDRLAEEQRQADARQEETDRQQAALKAEEDRKAAEEQARKDRIKAEEDAAAAELLAEAEAERQEQLRPEKERLTDWAAKLRFIDGPDDIKDEKLIEVMRKALNGLNTVSVETIAMIEDA